MSWFSKKEQPPIAAPADVGVSTPVGSSTDVRPTIELADLLIKYDLVEVVENEGSPFIVVTDKSEGAVNAPDRLTRDLVDSDFLERTYNEPSAAARSLGAPVQALPAAVPSQRVRMGDVAGTGNSASYGTQAVNLYELGTSSPSPWLNFARREYNQDLVGLRGLMIYDKMRRNDGIVRGTLRAVKTPVLSARWFIKPCDKNKVADVNASEFVWFNLTEYMTIGWSQVITEALLMCDFGYYMFEIVWEDAKVQGQDRIMVRKLAPRHPMDVRSWVYDSQGGVNGAYFYPNEIHEPDVFIPIDKLLVFTFDRESGNMEGISLLRSAYKHWYFKEQLYKIDAIQKERHGIGVPVIKLPVGFTTTDKSLANDMGRNLRTNERAHIVLPPLWEIMFAKLEGHVVNALDSVNQHDEAIRENILLQFMSSRESGSDEKQMMFLKATRFIADIVSETFNYYLVPKMIAANFTRVGNPQLKARRIGEQADWRTLSFAVRNLIGCGALIADDKLEEFLRDEMDLPETDIDTRRYVLNINADPNSGTPGDTATGDTNTPDVATNANTKQNGAQAGLPRQAKQANAPGSNKTAGRDGSGG